MTANLDINVEKSIRENTVLAYNDCLTIPKIESIHIIGLAKLSEIRQTLVIFAEFLGKVPTFAEDRKY